MRIEITKGETSDRIAITRDDGSRAETRFPKKGPFPHDAVHFVVESEAGFQKAFWGHAAAGAHPEDIARLAAEAGHPSAKRGREPDSAVVELIQAERLVECFEAELWGGVSELAALQSVADAAMAQSKVPSVSLGDSMVEAIRERLCELRVKWNATPAGQSITLIWNETLARTTQPSA